MDIVQIVFVSAVVFPVIGAVAVMLFVRHSIAKLKKKKLHFEETVTVHKKVINSLERVVEKQDIVLDVYREVTPIDK